MKIDTKTSYRLSLNNGPVIFNWNGKRINDLMLEIEKLDDRIKPLLKLSIYNGYDALEPLQGFNVKAIDSLGLCIIGAKWDKLQSIYQVLKTEKTDGIIFINGLFLKCFDRLPNPTYLVELGLNHGKIVLNGLVWCWTYCNSIGSAVAGGETSSLEDAVTAINNARTLIDKGMRI